MANKKIWISKHLTLSSLDEKSAEFDVEAKPNNKWVEVGGPFSDRASANVFAQQYSTDNPDVEVRVVVIQ